MPNDEAARGSTGGRGAESVPSSRPKYSLPEIERRWTVEENLLPPLESVPYENIEDLYVRGTRLRLRKVTGQDGEMTFKLGKKYPLVGPHEAPITNLYLSAAEYDVLVEALTGDRLRKRRYKLLGGALDVPTEGLGPMFSVEFGDTAQAAAYEPPAFAGPEVLQSA